MTYDLIGWKQIAAALGVSRATAQRMEQRFPDMPVIRINRRLKAYKTELQGWYHGLGEAREAI